MKIMMMMMDGEALKVPSTDVKGASGKYFNVLYSSPSPTSPSIFNHKLHDWNPHYWTKREHITEARKRFSDFFFLKE